MNLIKNYLSERSQTINFPAVIKYILSKYKTKDEYFQEPSAKLRNRCYLCKRAKNKMTTIQ